MAKNIFILISVCLCYIFMSCASKINPAILELQFQRAQESISSARKAQAEEYAESQLNKAIQLLNEAREAQKVGKDETVWELMFQSELEAKIAQAKAREVIAQERIKRARSEQVTAFLKKMEHTLKAAEARQKIAEHKAKVAEDRARKAQQDAAKARQNANHAERNAEKTILRNKAILEVSKAELMLQAASDAEAEEYASDEYKNASRLISDAKNLIDNGDYDEAERKAREAKEIASRAITGAETARTAIEKRQTQAYIDTKIAIAKAQFIFDMAKKFNAAEHASEEFDKAKITLEQANRAVEQKEFDSALRLAAQAKINATNAKKIAQVKEQARIERESREEMIARTKDAIFKAEEAVNRVSSELPEIVPELYKKAQQALKEAKSAVEERDYELASVSAQKSLTYMTDAKQKVKTISEVEDKLIESAKGIPKVQTERTNRGVLIRFSGDIFASGSSTLNRNYYSRLKALADILKQYPEYNVSIEGHTDSIGESDVNLRLSNRRAYNFFKHLVDKYDIPENQLNPVGYGERRPIASNRTRRGRERNRRIDVIILTRQK